MYSATQYFYQPKVSSNFIRNTGTPNCVTAIYYPEYEKNCPVHSCFK